MNYFSLKISTAVKYWWTFYLVSTKDFINILDKYFKYVKYHTFLWVVKHVSDLIIHLSSNLFRSEGFTSDVGARDRGTHDAGMYARILSAGIMEETS